MTRWPPRLDPETERFNLQALGVGCLIFTGYLASVVRLTEPLSLIPLLVVYTCLQALFRLGARHAERPRRARTFLFIA